MQSPSAVLPGEHSMILHRNSKSGLATGFMMELYGQKRSTCGRRCLFQDHVKAVMLAHQYNRVNRIAWLRSWKRLWAFLTVFLLSGVWYKTNSRTTGLYIVKRGVIWCLVNYRRAIPCDPLCCDGFFQSHIIREKRTFDKSISTPKLSALQHRCLRFLLLLKRI